MESKLIITILLCINIALNAQQPAEIFKKIIAVQTEQFNATYRVNFYYYDNWKAKHPMDSLRMSIIRYGDQYFLQADEIELLNDGKVVLTIDKEQREIILQPEANQKPQFGLEQFLSFAIQEGIKLESFNPGKGKGGLRFSAPGYSETVAEMIYDLDTYLLRSTDLSISVNDDFYASEYNYTRLRATYDSYDFSKRELPVVSSQIIKKSGNGYVAIGKYKGFVVK